MLNALHQSSVNLGGSLRVAVRPDDVLVLLSVGGHSVEIMDDIENETLHQVPTFLLGEHFEHAALARVECEFDIYQISGFHIFWVQHTLLRKYVAFICAQG